MATKTLTRPKKKAAAKRTTKKSASPPQLARYQSMRDFDQTEEPSGATSEQSLPANAYLIQKHAATRLHYDLRLALDGVLKSWAVTKGPSLDPNERRLAVEVEDHPLDYGTFEGTIPKGQYGGGTVMLWDRGTWTPVGDPHEGLRKGHLKFELDGERLKGRWVLVRMGGRAAREKKPNWLLIKERDGLEREGGPPVTDDYMTSVTTDRAMEQIAGDADRVWQSKPRTPVEPPANRKITGGKKGKLPDFVPVQLATRVKAPPAGDNWLHEIKFDGYRTELRLDRGKVQFLTRRGLDWTDRFASLVEPATTLRAETALIDGEVIVLDAKGVSDFGALQAYLSEGKKAQLLYYAFDLLHLDGQDLTDMKLERRKDVLRELLSGFGGDDPIRYSDHVVATGDEFYAQACRLALEGVISKRRDSPYRSGRSDAWVKSKCVERQEFVIGGWTPPTDRAPSVGNLLLGAYEGDKLVYVGKVGTGFTRASGADLRKRLEKLKAGKHPFDRKPPDSRDAQYVKPELVAEIEYLTMTRDRVLRHASFKGLREDKEARSVTMERPKETQEQEIETKVPATGVRKGDTLLIAGARITHPDRRIDEESGLTKEGLAEYLALVADRMLPHVAGRPLSVVRCPDGSGKSCFYQKHIGRGMPPGVKSVHVPEKDGSGEYLMIDDLQGLLGLAQMGVLEIHPWGARGDDPETPDRLIFDFDPDPDLPYQRVIDGAVALRARLQDLGLESFVKTTGGKGLHVVVPIARKYHWPVIKEFSRAVATAVAKDDPGFVVTMTKAKRTGKIFLDFFRNDRGATAVAPYSTRARPGAPVATPLFWDELSPQLPPNHFTVENLPRRLATLKEDPWAKMLTLRQGVTAKMLASLKVKS